MHKGVAMSSKKINKSNVKSNTKSNAKSNAKSNTKSNAKYKKIEVFRQSNLPVNMDNLKAYKDEWRRRFDEIVEANPDMKIVNELSDALEIELLTKYKQNDHWDWVDSQRNWKKLTKEYGPIAVCHAESGKLIYLILDRF